MDRSLPHSPLLVVGAFALCLRACIAEAEAGQVEATHVLSLQGDHVHLSTRWYDHAGGLERSFASPLPPQTAVAGRGVTATRDADDGSIVGVTFDAPPEYPVVLEFDVPRAAVESLIPLPLPEAAGWQRVEVEGGHRLVPSLGAELPMHTAGYYGPGDLHTHERMRIDRRLDRRHPGGAAYLPGDTLIAAGGLPAQLESGAARKLGLGAAVGAVFVAGLVVFAVVIRRQDSVIAAEEAEAYLAEEFRSLMDAGAGAGAGASVGTGTGTDRP